VTGRRRAPRRRVRVYLRARLGCLGCSVPILGALVAAVVLAVAL
jgi:hypothetical protein